MSVIGFGAWGIGGQWGKVEIDQAIDAMNAAYDAGVNFFDTADAYGLPFGDSEHMVGKAFQGKRDKVYIATKVGNFLRRYGKPLPYEDPATVELCCDSSLFRLKTDYIDLYQCHIGDCTEPDVFLEAFDRLIDKGKIRAFGISSNRLDVIQGFNRDGRCTSAQIDYSYINRSAERDVLPYCHEHGIGTIIRGPLRKGICAGKFTADTTFTDSVRERWNSGEGRKQFLKELAIAERVRFLERPDRTMARAALQFVISHPAVTTAIPGAKNREQALANAEAGNNTLTPEELEKVRGLTPPYLD
ncbi:MAG: aldo/keto reductase [Gammaproteobacteria bacterium]|nr:MAG: aldo/keto reductase [Gammaproteobacteria bacterium]